MNYDSEELRDREFARKLRAHQDKLLKEFGWYAHYVPGDPDSPTNFNGHTHGFAESWGHPDVQIVIAMPTEQIHGVLSTIAEAVKAGKTFEPGRKYDDVLQGYPVMFAWTQEGNRRVLRMILPDPEGGVMRDEISEPYSVQWNGTEE